MSEAIEHLSRTPWREPARYVVSPEVADSLQAELEALHELKEREFAQRLRDARGFGDGADNDEVMAIREEEAVLDARIAALEDMLLRARVADGEALTSGAIMLGSTATVEDLETRKSERYSIVGMHEQLQPGEVSVGSPIGQALLGRRVGETVTVDLPRGRARRLQIVGS
jgi:transcription elongation factor GreA